MVCTHPNPRYLVSAFLDIPKKYFCKLSKSAIRDREVKINGVDWDKITIYCPDCSKIIYTARDGGS